MESQTCAVGGWGAMFGTKSQKNVFFYTFPKAKTHFLQKGPFPPTELAENLCVDSQAPHESDADIFSAVSSITLALLLQFYGGGKTYLWQNL